MGGNYLAQTPIRQIGCDLHRMSVTGNPFRHVRSEHSVAMELLKKVAEHLQESGEVHRGMHTGADSLNIETKRRCAWPMKNRSTALLRHVLKFLERIVDGRIRAVV